MPTTPNEAFKGRHQVNPDNHKELTGMMITLFQKHQLTGLLWELGIPWDRLYMAVFHKHKNMSDCTFHEATRCLIVAGVWENRKEADIE